jgi:hypothetical protein
MSQLARNHEAQPSKLEHHADLGIGDGQRRNCLRRVCVCVCVCWFMIASSRKLMEPTKQPPALRARTDARGKRFAALIESRLDKREQRHYGFD